MERAGRNLPRGFHAVDDHHKVRSAVYDVIRRQAPRFDSTFLEKSKAYTYVLQRGEVSFYKLAWYQHFKYVAPRVTSPGDSLHIVAATLTTSRRKSTVRDALQDVVDQVIMDRSAVLCTWDSASTWGLQVADYGLWAIQRDLIRGGCQWFDSSIKPTEATRFRPFA